MTISAYPLSWPAGWLRTVAHKRASVRFGKASRARAGGGWDNGRPLTITEAIGRVRSELTRMRIHDDDLVISSDLQLRMDGLPRGNQSEPADPGAAVYWRDGEETRCMAIDRYDRVADNLAAIAATLDAMRAIDRHGGAEILNRAYAGFTALPAPVAGESPWYVVLGVSHDASAAIVEQAYKRLRSVNHSDKGGDDDLFIRVQRAYEQWSAQR